MTQHPRGQKYACDIIESVAMGGWLKSYVMQKKEVLSGGNANEKY